jgi:hypothetical protein
MNEIDHVMYHYYVAGYCFGRVKPADKVLTPNPNNALLAAALALGVHDGGTTNDAPRPLSEIRDEAKKLAAG